MLFCVILLLLICTKIMLLLLFYLINFSFFMKIIFIFSCSGMFRHVPERSVFLVLSTPHFCFSLQPCFDCNNIFFFFFFSLLSFFNSSQGNRNLNENFCFNISSIKKFNTGPRYRTISLTLQETVTTIHNKNNSSTWWNLCCKLQQYSY